MYLVTFGILQAQDKKENDIVILIKKAIIEQRKHNYDAAQKILHIALCNAQHFQDDQATTYIFDLMGNVALESKSYNNAEKLFKEVLKRLITFDKTTIDAPQFIEISLKLADIYSKTNRAAEAESGYNFCLKQADLNLKNILNSKSQINDWPYQDAAQLTGMVHHHYAKHLLSLPNTNKAQISKAVVHLRKALEIALSFKIENTSYDKNGNFQNTIAAIDYTSYYNDIQTSHFLKEDKYRVLKAEFEDSQTSQNPLIPNLHNDLAVALENLGQVDEAIAELQLAIDLTLKIQALNALRMTKPADEYEKFKCSQLDAEIAENLLTFYLNLYRLHDTNFFRSNNLSHKHLAMESCQSALQIASKHKQLNFESFVERLKECNKYI